ncbi:DUF2200 domain-containing protein [Alkalicoccus urumqiensis]|uniref:DUF2200 domain-containing protein n=1 Tax=Alkalicoccus urumqiensis TaxID=1548213 RepID=A0A2P6MIU8_ALKUR|nr:DUF2200 domain-containing protein [Alkalicoccus urumqiensis]PRO66198.1 DUF2200 domain-containing protein [Alkalicoccus urumqiensis]
MGHKIFQMAFADIYPHYVNKAERKGRTKEEVDEIIYWLTGYTEPHLKEVLDQRVTMETFFAEAPSLNESRRQITGVICGVRVENIEDPLMQEIRYMDKLIDELAKGKKMEKILRTA